MNKLSSSVSELHSNFLESCEILNDFGEQVRTMLDDLTGANEFGAEIGRKLLKGESTPYHMLFDFENKAREEIEELTKDYTERWQRFAVSYPGTFENMVFIYLIAIFDAFFEDLTEVILIHVPSLIEPVNYSNREEQVQKEMRKFGMSFANQVDFWKSKFGIAIEASGIEFDLINLMYEKRHILVHRNGIVDDKFIRNTGSKDYKKGESIKIEPNYFYDSLDKLQKVSDYVIQEVVSKFC